MYRSIPGFDPERKASEDPDDSYDWNIYTDATTALPDVSARLSEAITNGEPRWYIEGLGKIRAHQTTISHSSFALSSQSQQQLSEAVEPSQPAQIPTLGNLCLGLLARARLLLVQGTLPISLNCSCPEKEDTRTPPVLQVAKDQCIRATKLSIPILETSNIEPVTPGKVCHTTTLSYPLTAVYVCSILSYPILSSLIRPTPPFRLFLPLLLFPCCSPLHCSSQLICLAGHSRTISKWECLPSAV